ncbi:glycosyl transferase family protein [Paraburkholderia bannensis]|uniref:glycosyl transferase family protein n=1 Tax=Paraburkholderia bannensis TaxID=765414 RepID=UPI002AB64842|nr:glycosyl transferase family protein [Paraburkholderia bannensis]
MMLATLGFYGRIALAQYYQWLEHAAVFISAIILLSSLDDLFIDLWYWIRETVRHFTIKRQYKPLTVAQLHQRTEQPLAIIVPAWQEHDVIAAMIEDLVRVLDYRAYRVFVGTYQNDAATIAEVERMRHRYKHLHRVEVPHDGPTCKADCLNWIVQAVFRYEFEAGTEFAGVVMHDSEDVLHPLELKFFNYLLPRKDMIQLPVASLEREWCELVAGTYMDEFAEWHAKDLVVRESLVGAVPSAGVGTCFSRRAMLALIADTEAQPFNTESLTEDYDIGERIGRMGLQSIFARFPVQFVTHRTSWFGLGPEREVTTTMPLCVREYFPDTLRTAYRQRARWTLGIGLQGWALTGWTGSIANRYLLLRDRKGVVTSFVGMVGYLLVIQFMLFALASLLGLTPDLFPSPFIDSPWMDTLLTANFIALLLRVTQRVIFTTRLYGWEHGVLAVPRLVISNFINFLAALRAWRLFLIHLVTGKRLTWDKTMHDFPSAGGLRNTRQTLGELLVSWQAIDPATLERALHDEHAREAPLGRVLMANGWLDEETLAEAVAFQTDLPRGNFVPAKLDDPDNQVPIDVLVRLRTLPQGLDENGHAVFVAASLLSDAAIDDLHALAQRTVSLHIVRESEVTAGLRILRRAEEPLLTGAHGEVAVMSPADLGATRGVPLLGDLLIEMGLVSRARFDAALQDYRPERDGRIGDFMVARHIISREALQSAIAAQQQLRDAQTGGR